MIEAGLWQATGLQPPAILVSTTVPVEVPPVLIGKAALAVMIIGLGSSGRMKGVQAVKTQSTAREYGRLKRKAGSWKARS